MIRIAPRIALILACVLGTAASAQEVRAPRNALYVEMLGPAMLGSLNYERIAGDRVSLRVGLGGIPEIFEVSTTLSAPVLVNLFIGSGEHRLETGAGIVAVYVLPHSEPGAWERVSEPGFRRTELTGTLAYRWQPGAGSIFPGGVFRAGFTPVLRGETVYPRFGFSVGAAF